MKIGVISLGRLGTQIYREARHRGHGPWGTYANSPKGFEGERRFDIKRDPLPGEVFESDWIVFNLPPSAYSLESFKRFLNQALETKIVFVSSTSVYGQEETVDETSQPKPKSGNGKMLLSCERLLEERGGTYKIVRPAGLYGPSRHPGAFLSGKETSSNPEASVNLVDERDLSRLILDLLERPGSPPVLNAVNLNHPSKKDYYAAYCRSRDLQEPKFTGAPSGKGKTVNTIYSDYVLDSELP